MKVEISSNKNTVIFDFFPELQDENLMADEIYLKNRSCFFELPFEFKSPHPDLIALAVVLCVYPFVAEEIELPFSVSKNFSDTFYKLTKKKIGPVSEKIIPRVVEFGRPSLSYSGGVDSTAALALMPKNTKVFFLDRVMPLFRKALYDKTAPLLALQDVFSSGYDGCSVPSNMEYLRSRVGFPIDLSTAVPILLSADEYSIDSVAFGMVFESAYRMGHEHFLDYTIRSHFVRWGGLFNSVGCNLFLPVAGVTEVGTYIINNKFSISEMTRSCMRGGIGASCGRCVKCFRKSLLNSSVTKSVIDSERFLNNLSSKEVLKTILAKKIKHENIYRYISVHARFSGPVGGEDFSAALKDRVVFRNEDVNWMEKWFPDSLVFIPEKYRDEFTRNLSLYLDVMNDDDVRFVRSWGENPLKEIDVIERILCFKSCVSRSIQDCDLVSYIESI